MAQVTTIIHNRHVLGKTTTLRQLHKISDFSQPQALTLITELERAGIVIIEENVGDAFESTVTLTDNARGQLEDATNEADVKSAA